MSRSLLFVLSLSVILSYETGSALAGPCTYRFIEHPLPHTTQTRVIPVHFYEGNGSGVAINDLNNDGLLDIVLGNLHGPNTILWNEDGLNFRTVSFAPTGRTRGISLVDVDADDWLDIVLTTQVGAPILWHNNGDESFKRMALDGVRYPAYTLDWADIDADGDLDLATASYDSELLLLLRDSYLFNSNGGVYVYENRNGTFIPTRLSDEARGLAVWLSDLDHDGSADLFVGNDFAVPDQSWSLQDGQWIADTPFNATTFSTMSFDAGDIDNNGTLEFFAADMRPTSEDAETQRAWRYVLQDLAQAPRLPHDRQITENVLQQRHASRHFRNVAPQYGAAATGWTWSAKFGDLDQDGFLDLYAVNGMDSIELFSHLPHSSLVEPNMAFRNEAGTAFTLMPEWGLGSLASGRGMSMGDLDNDGDLDIVVNNLNSPSALFENDLCSGSSLQVQLRWPGSENVYGIGSRLTLSTSSGTYTRDLRATSGYISGDPARLHFGFPSDSQLYALEIEWPDDQVTRITQFSADSFLTVTR